MSRKHSLVIKLYIYKKILQKMLQNVRKCMRARARIHTYTQNFFRIG